MSEEELCREIKSGAFSMQVADCDRNIRIQFEKLQQENKQLKEHIEKYEHYCKTTGIEELMKENKKLKERIRKAIELNKQVIKDTKEFYRPTKDIIYSGDTLIDIAEQNLKILKEVE